MTRPYSICRTVGSARRAQGALTILPCSRTVLAYRGRITEARAAGVAQIHESTARSQGGPADIGRYIVAVADLFGGDNEAATSAAQRVVEDDPAFTAEAALSELIEAAIRSGDHETVGAAYKTSPNARAPPERHGHSACARPLRSLARGR